MSKKEIWHKIFEILIYALSAFSGGICASSCTSNVNVESTAIATAVTHDTTSVSVAPNY